jgi:hypothetical protein
MRVLQDACLHEGLRHLTAILSRQHATPASARRLTAICSTPLNSTLTFWLPGTAAFATSKTSTVDLWQS